jgi:hypothetical protein
VCEFVDKQIGKGLNLGVVRTHGTRPIQAQDNVNSGGLARFLSVGKDGMVGEEKKEKGKEE